MVRADFHDGEDDRSAQDRRKLFEAEVMRLMDRLYGTALRLTRDPDEAEDVVAESIGKAWAKLDDLRDLRCLEGWLFRILNNTFISAWRRRQSRRTAEAEIESCACDVGTGGGGAGTFSLYEQLHQPFLLWWSTPQDQLLDSILQDDIQRALDSLPEEYRVAVVLVEVEGYTYHEAAAMLGVPLGTIRSRLSRGRGLLQKSLWEQAREAGLVTGDWRPRARNGEERS